MYRSVFCMVALVAFILVGCSSTRPFVAPALFPPDTLAVAKPEPDAVYILADGFHQQVTVRFNRLFSISRHLRKGFGRYRQALNRNAFDEVDDSSWFTNRHGRTPLSLAALAQGPNRGAGPDTTGTWTLRGAKTQGVTPGFTIKDRHGDTYIIKLGIPGYLELNSAAEIITTKFFYAAGYNVPENYIVYFRPEKIVMGNKVKITDPRGRKRFMTQSDLDTLLSKVPRLPDGRTRAVASRFLEGEPLGPFRYEGTRADDANDFLPHQHRRELRGLGVFSSWLNHYDTKANNSLDVYVKAGYVRHYLIDFGSTLGSQGDEPMPAWIGHEYNLDPPQIATNILTAGLRVHPYEKEHGPISPAVGYFESELFNPATYKPIFPNPAFDQMTDADGFWGAKLVMAFSDAEIAAIVAEGWYTNAADEAYMIKTLIERRDKIGRYWFERVNPLDRFVVEGQYLHFQDLAVETGLARAGATQYRYQIHTGGERSGRWEGPIAKPAIPLGPAEDDERIRSVWIEIRRQGGDWSKAIQAFVQPTRQGDWALIGIRRQ